MQGKISQGHAKMLVSLDKNEQKLVIDTILGQKLNVRDTEKMIQRVKKKESLAQFDENYHKELKKLQETLSEFGIESKIKRAQIILNLADTEKIKELNAKLS